MRIKRVLISVWDKNGVADFARALESMGAEIISSGGTASALEKQGIKVTLVSSITESPEMLGGRVKTLHPKIHGGILAKRADPEHMKALEEHGIASIDMVVCNLYPFKDVVSREHTLDQALENIDIGGPAMVRAAAKNYGDVVVVPSPKHYDRVLEELRGKGDVSEETRAQLARDAFAQTAEYDDSIQRYFGKQFDGEEFPSLLNLRYEKVQDLRYGENQHQKAALYRELGLQEPCLANEKQLHGKMLSFNNIVDINDSLELISEFDEPAVAILKHTNPSGVAQADTVFAAYEKALATDPISAFGGIIVANRKLDAATAEEIKKRFYEVVVAPDYDKDAIDVLKKKKNLRIIKIDDFVSDAKRYDVVGIMGGALYQTYDDALPEESGLRAVTERKPSKDELNSMLFAWKVTKHVKSNAIVFARGFETIGIGAGQMSRVDAVELAVKKARAQKGDPAGSVMASDSFFPFRDAVDVAADAGILAIIQPGGSIRDQEVVDAANERGIAMVFSNMRCFKH